jgi:hypothetical protein
MNEEGKDKFKIKILCISREEPEIRQMENHLNNHWKGLDRSLCWSSGTSSSNYSSEANKRVKEGTHPSQVDNSWTKTEEGRKIHSESAKKRVLEGTHPFLGGKIQRKTSQKRVLEGTHNLLKKGMTTCLDLQENRVHRITSEEFKCNPTRYFGNNSNAAKAWRLKNSL